MFLKENKIMRNFHSLLGERLRLPVRQIGGYQRLGVVTLTIL
jgi:hypothetical protein